MLSPSEYDRLCDQLILIYDDLDRSIIQDMTRRMMRMGYVSEATKWQAEMLQQSGMLYEDVIAEIARISDAEANQVRTLFEDAGVQSIRNDNRSYRAAGLEGIVKMSDSALQTLNAGYIKCQRNLSNLTLTTANTSQSAYINACNLAYMQVTSGTVDYNTAIRHAVQNIAEQGSYVLYPTGHRDRIDVAVRRSVLTGVGQTVRQLSLINANDIGCDLMEITAHAGARPSHAVWQGQIVSLSGKRGYLSLYDIGYGTGDGFGGWNCRHDWHPFFEGISDRTYSDSRLQELNARNIDIDGNKYTEYEVSQMQRAMERKVREMKRRVCAADTMVQESQSDSERKKNQDYFSREFVKLKKAEQKLKDFLNKTGELPDSNRTWVNGFGRSTSQKATWANRKVQQAKQAKVSKTKSSSGTSNIPKPVSNTVKSDSDFVNKLKNIVSGRSYMNAVDEFADNIQNIQNENVRNIFKNVHKNAVFDRSKRKNSYFSPKENKVYITKASTPSTIAHELFHKVDFDNKITESGLLDSCIKSDYENLKKMSENAGLSIGDMLYLKYPEAFREQGKMQESYRGVSDIIEGMTNGQTCLGYGHFKGNKNYWSKPLALQRETFAQYGRFYFDENSDMMRMINDIFPETSKQMNNIIKIIGRFGR